MDNNKRNNQRVQGISPIEITVLDPVECSVSREDGIRLTPLLSFATSYWKPGRFHKEEVPYDKKVFTRHSGSTWRFLTGLIPRVRQWCSDENMPLQIHQESDLIPPFEPTYNAGMYTLREDQFELIYSAVKGHRGVIKAPTGSGKTILQMGVCEWFYDSNILILSHTSNLVIQTAQKISDHGFDVQQIGGGKQFEGRFTSDIVVSTRQSFARIRPDLYCDHFPVVMIDETHHLTANDNQYAGILRKMLAPIRLGFSATPHTMNSNPEAVFATEGLLGPVIGELTMNEAREIGILAKPKVKIVKVPYDGRVKQAKGYPNVYQLGVVQRSDRNEMIMEIASQHVVKGETVLIFVTKLGHAKRLQLLADSSEILGGCTRSVKGDVDAMSREETRQAFISKEVKCVISTIVWSEGVDIVNLNAIIMAGIQKSEIRTMQNVGRGLRKTDGKEEVIIYDFFDNSHHYLIEHFGHRISTYCDLGWIG